MLPFARIRNKAENSDTHRIKFCENIQEGKEFILIIAIKTKRFLIALFYLNAEDFLYSRVEHKLQIIENKLDEDKLDKLMWKNVNYTLN